MRKKKVYIAYTGGTIGMLPGDAGYQPEPGYLSRQLALAPQLNYQEMPDFDIHEYQPLLDSAEMTPANWLEIAQDIYRNYKDYDGFVILHGTDTMSYTASALAFILRGIAKPVIITGSQIPLSAARSDGWHNLSTALLLAGNYNIPEVALCFGGRLFRGCRTVKVSAHELDAFESPNFPPLATLGGEIRVNQHLLLPLRASLSETVNLEHHLIGILRLFPGISISFMENILNTPLKGLIIEAYGRGNGSSRDKAFLALLKEAVARGVVIVACTQCLTGEVNLTSYATGNALAEAGVISGGDMTTEAAFTKLYYLLGRGLEGRQIKLMMQENLRGELTTN